MFSLKLIFFTSLAIYAINGVISQQPYQDATKAIAVMNGYFNNAPVNGTILFEQKSPDDVLTVTVNLTGLPIGQSTAKHGLHVHQSGIKVVSSNITEICGSSGMHFNPDGLDHGDITAKIRHVGDYGNVIADDKGYIITTFTDSVSKLYGPYGVLGRTIVLHQLEDDLGLQNNTGSKTTGNSGARIACGVIGLF